MAMVAAAALFFWITAASSALGSEIQISLICDEWPPYQIAQEQGITGFSVEIVTEVFQRMNVHVRDLRTYPWKRAITMIEKNLADALFSANFSPERLAFARYPKEPLVISPWVMWVREDEPHRFTGLEDLLGKKIGVVRGYTYTDAFWNFIRTHGMYEEVANDEQNFRRLAAKRVDFVVAELGNGYYILQNSGVSHIRPLTTYPVKTDGLYLIFNKKTISQTFVDRFSDELRRLKSGPVYQAVFDKYFRL